jgi:hypothetical protein
MGLDLANYESPQVRILHEWARGFLEKDRDLLTKHLHKDLCVSIYPRSIGKPDTKRDEWIKVMGEALDANIEFLNVCRGGCYLILS